MPQREILDPQGKAVEIALAEMGLDKVNDVRIGKQIEFTIAAESAEIAHARVNQATMHLLANPIMEEFTIEVLENS